MLPGWSPSLHLSEPVPGGGDRDGRYPAAPPPDQPLPDPVPQEQEQEAPAQVVLPPS